VTGPSSTPRGEKSGRPGVTWEQQLVRVEQVVDDNEPDPTPPNRATRRALARATRRTASNAPDDGPSVREAAADDRAHWTQKYAGE
jgi:hypothetical protein